MPAQRRTAGTGPQFLQVQTTTDSRAEAVELAQAAVEQRLAACAQVAGPIASTDWWEDGLEKAEEWLIMPKLPAERFDDLAEFLAERHSYDDPEIIAMPIVAGSRSYLDWVAEEDSPAMTPEPDDHGLYGPGSVTWRVASEPVMSIAGVRAMYLQALHPRVMLGTWQNTAFADPDEAWGRFTRTVRFVRIRTYQAPRRSAAPAAACARSIPRSPARTPRHPVPAG